MGRRVADRLEGLSACGLMSESLWYMKDRSFCEGSNWNKAKFGHKQGRTPSSLHLHELDLSKISCSNETTVHGAIREDTIKVHQTGHL